MWTWSLEASLWMKTSWWISVKSQTVRLWPTRSDILEETVRLTSGCENLRVHTEEETREWKSPVTHSPRTRPNLDPHVTTLKQTHRPGRSVSLSTTLWLINHLTLLIIINQSLLHYWLLLINHCPVLIVINYTLTEPKVKLVMMSPCFLCKSKNFTFWIWRYLLIHIAWRVWRSRVTEECNGAKV